MVADLTFRDVRKVVELFIQMILVLKTTPFLDSGLFAWLNESLSHAVKMSVFLAVINSRSLRSSMVFCLTLLKPSIPFSADSHRISTDERSNTASR